MNKYFGGVTQMRFGMRFVTLVIFVTIVGRYFREAAVSVYMVHILQWLSSLPTPVSFTALKIDCVVPCLIT